jgi:hypothetical protein
VTKSGLWRSSRESKWYFSEMLRSRPSWIVIRSVVPVCYEEIINRSRTKIVNQKDLSPSIFNPARESLIRPWSMDHLKLLGPCLARSWALDSDSKNERNHDWARNYENRREWITPSDPVAVPTDSPLKWLELLLQQGPLLFELIPGPILSRTRYLRPLWNRVHSQLH